jgi:methyl-accepting chemotaxis protein
MRIAHKLVAKLAAVLLVPTLGMSYYGFTLISQARAEAQAADGVAKTVELARDVGAVVHSIQIERGMTAALLGGDTSISTRLGKARQDTDAAVTQLARAAEEAAQSSVPRSMVEGVTRITEGFEGRQAIRRSADDAAISGPEAIGFYTRTNAEYLARIADAARLAESPDLARRLGAYQFLLRAKECSGIERALLANTFAAGAFAPGIYERWIAVLAEQTAFMAEFRAGASDALLAAADRAAAHPSTAAVERYRLGARAGAAGGGFGVDAAEWFAAATARIDELRGVETLTADDLGAAAAGLAAAKARVPVRVTLVMAGILGVGLIVTMLFALSIGNPIFAVLDHTRRLATGDFSAKLGLRRGDELGHVARAIDEMSAGIGTMISEVTGCANEVAGAATEIAATAEQMASGLSHQEAQTSEVSAAIEQLSCSVVGVAGKSAEAANAADNAGGQADDGRLVVSETITEMRNIARQVNESVEAVAALGVKSEQIGTIIAVIDDIADQTNLLALNAAIEAARAGEHGRGFAVVADEVRKLAERTQQATEEVATSIRQIQADTKSAITRIKGGAAQVETGVGKASAASDALGLIVDGSRTLKSMVDDIAHAVEEQTAATKQIAAATSSIAAVTRESSSAAIQASEAASNLSEQSERLLSLTAKFKI